MSTLAPKQRRIFSTRKRVTRVTSRGRAVLSVRLEGELPHHWLVGEEALQRCLGFRPVEAGAYYFLLGLRTNASFLWNHSTPLSAPMKPRGVAP